MSMEYCQGLSINNQMKVINGKQLSSELRTRLKEKISQIELSIGLAVVIVGDDPASQIYVRNKIKACEEVGIRSLVFELPSSVSQAELEELLVKLGKEQNVHGILLQLPLPKGFDAESAMAKIPTNKDVDGFTAENLGKLALHKEEFVACTPLGIMTMLKEEGISLAGKHAVVLGRSDTVGKPMAMLLLNADATVTVCHSKTDNLKEICRQADVLISAIGKPKFVTADMVKEGVVVIDVGMNRDENGRLCGDVDYENVALKSSYITPVPGGVGPMTITTLLYNTYYAALRALKE